MLAHASCAPHRKLRLLSLLLALLMLLSTALLFSCADENPADPQPGDPPVDEPSNPPADEPEPAPALPLVNEDGSFAFQIIRPDNCSTEAQNAAVLISTSFKAIYGKAPKLGNDYVDRNGVADYPEMKMEILVGPTNRPESKQVAAELGEEQYIIRVVNQKIVIVGKNDFCLDVAADYFVKHYLKGTTVSVPENLNHVGVCDYMYTFTVPKNASDRYELLITAATVQGVYNPTAERKLYIIDSAVSAPTNVLNTMTNDERWLSTIDRVNIGGDLERLLEIAQNYIKSVVIWDPQVPATVNVATTVAGVETGIVMTPTQYDVYANDLPADVKVISLVGKFTGEETGSAKNDAYRWAIREYLATGKCSTSYICSFEDAYGRDPRYTYPRDVAVREKAFVFDLSPWSNEVPKDDQTQKLGTDLATYMMILETLQQVRGKTSVTEIIGFFPGNKYSDSGNDDVWTSKYKGTQVEWEYAYLFTPYQCYWNPSAEYAMNMTVHSTYEIPEDLWQNRPEEDIELNDSEDMIYMMIVMGDYDSVGSFYTKMTVNWENRFRGKLPLAWSFNPNIIDHYPDLVEYFYKTATPNDYFVANVGGAGWYNPSRVEDTEEQWEMWLAHHKKYFELTDMSVSPDMWDFDAFSPMAEKYITQYATTGAGTLISNQLGHSTTGAKPTVPHIAENGSVLDEISNRYDRNDPVKCAQGWKIDLTKRDESREGHATFMSCRCVWSTPEHLYNCITELQKLYPDKEIKVVDPFTYYRLLGESLENN